MKILFSIDSMYKGGAEHVMANLCNHFSKENDVTLVYTNDRGINYNINDKVNLYCLDNIIKYKNFILKNIIRVINLKKIIKKTNPDVILTFLPNSSFLILFSNLFNSRKIIISVRSNPNFEFSNKFKKILMKILYKRANAFVFQTEFARQYFKNINNNSSIIINNSLDEKFMREPFNGIRRNEIVTVGRLSKEKNHILLLRAFKEVLKKYPNYQLIIYGTGAEKGNIEEEIKKLEIGDNISLPGNVDDIYNRIYDSEVFVLSSEYEGVPNALLEAMSLGLPVVSTNYLENGPYDLIQNHFNGIVVPRNDYLKISAAIIEIISNKEFSRQLGNNASKIKKDFNPIIINRKWEDFIKQIGGVNIEK